MHLYLCSITCDLMNEFDDPSCFSITEPIRAYCRYFSDCHEIFISKIETAQYFEGNSFLRGRCWCLMLCGLDKNVKGCRSVYRKHLVTYILLFNFVRFNVMGIYITYTAVHLISIKHVQYVYNLKNSNM